MAERYDPASHYDRVTPAWALLLGEELHYGVFETPRQALKEATRNLTDLMVDALNLEPGTSILDVGCGTGTVACDIARGHQVTIVGITTSKLGVIAATDRASREGLAGRADFELRDGTQTGFADQCFDRVLILEASHLIRDRQKLFAECARVLAPDGRLALCDIMLNRALTFQEVKTLRRPLAVLREVFGDAHMEPMGTYIDRLAAAGLEVDLALDLTQRTRPTFDAWRENASQNRSQAEGLLGQSGLASFVEACQILADLWDDGVMGYGLLGANQTQPND